MRNIQASIELIFTGSDLSRPRLAVEHEKMAAKFPGMKFYAAGETIKSVQGYLSTKYGNRYYVRIDIPKKYPYVMPSVWLPYERIDNDCPAVYLAGNICLMKSDQWTSAFSLALVVAMTAKWLDKYDVWKAGGKKRWPGRSQHL